MKPENKFLISIIIIILVLGASISTIVYYKNEVKPNTAKLFDTQPLQTQVIELRTQVDILKGQMKAYENVPIDLRTRMELLEGRYDSIVSFQNELCLERRNE